MMRVGVDRVADRAAAIDRLAQSIAGVVIGEVEQRRRRQRVDAGQAIEVVVGVGNAGSATASLLSEIARLLLQCALKFLNASLS